MVRGARFAVPGTTCWTGFWSFLSLFYRFFARQHCCADARYWYSNSVCPSVTFRYCIELSSAYRSPVILVFPVPNSDGVTPPPYGASNAGGVSKNHDFWPIPCFVLQPQLVLYASRNAYVIFRSVTFPMTLSAIRRSFQYCYSFVCAGCARSVSDS